MSYKISKELFEAVMGFKTKSITIGNFIIFWEMEDGYKPDYGISVDTFYFRCKEWAYSKGIEYMWSGRAIQYNDYYEPQFFCNIDWKKAKDFRANSEQQAVIDCCQWILDNKNKQ